MSFLKALRSWGALTDTLYIWHYNTNFANYLMPFPDFDEFPAGGRWRELAEVNIAGRRVFGLDSDADEGGQRKSGADRVFHNDYGR